jgi:undecaprenyl-diphosphatase
LAGRFGQLSPRAIFLSLTLGVAALAIGTFIRITQELLERDVDAVDRTLLLRVIAGRTPWLNAVMVDMTALGSATLVALFSLIALAVFVAMRAWSNALQLAASSLGSLVWTVVAKSFIERVRPQDVPRLVEASGYSYPSGHSLSSAALYLTLALLIGRYLSSHRARAAVIAGSLVLIAMVGFSRVYLGVHYPSDVASGVCAGIGWALLLNAALSSIASRAPS